ncbi:MAG: class I SAM-dependent methyltransferase [Candidatus Woesearchaeota archaeon]
MKSPWENNEFAELSLENIDEKFLPGTEKEVDFLENEFNLKNNDKVIDLGCGAGRHSIELASRNYDVVGIDISEKMLNKAKKRAENKNVKDKITFKKGDLSLLYEKFKTNNIIKLAICLCESGFGVLGGSKEDLKFLKNVLNILEKGGYMVLTTFNGLRRYIKSKDKNERFDYLNGILHWEGPEKNGDTLEEYQRLYIPSEIKLLFEIAGFKKVEVFGCQPGKFKKQKLKIEDKEMMIIGKKPL